MNFQTEYRCSLTVCMSRKTPCVIELYIQHNAAHLVHMNIDPCTSKVKVDMTWEANSIQCTILLSSPLFPHRFDNSSLSLHVIFSLLT